MSLLVSNNSIHHQKKGRIFHLPITLIIIFLILNILSSFQKCNCLPSMMWNIDQQFETMMKQFIKTSTTSYTTEARQLFTSQLLLQQQQQKHSRQSSSIPTGSWMLGDLTLYDENCNQQMIPLTLMNSTTSNGIAVSHSLSSQLSYTISTIVKRPLSSLYNAILRYNSDSIPICFNIKEGELAFTTDFLLCANVDTYTPACTKSNSGTVTSMSIVYKSPGSASSGIVAGIVVGSAMILGFAVLILVCCVVCCCKVCGK